MLTGTKHPLWKGEKSKYQAHHTWIARQLGKPSECSDCGTKEEEPRNYHWANISGKYKRDISDWKRLCVKCHKKFDATQPKGEETYNYKLTQDNVKEIKETYVFRKKGASWFAEKFKVSVSCIYRILEGKNWRHI